MAQAEASYFTFAKGINTEASLANWPEGFSVDEENYDLLIDGSRRKRKGTALASWATTLTSTSSSSPDALAYNTFYWDNVAGDPDIHYVIIQMGKYLRIYNNATTITDTPVFEYDLTSSAVSGATSTQIEQADVDFDSGFGTGFLVGRYITPTSITYSGGTFTVAAIAVEERDYQGQDDGIDLTTAPTSLSTAHQYNLRNRGWKDADITAYFSSKAAYPSKAMIPWLGYRRVTTAGVAEVDWTKAFSPDKLIAELFQDVSAPQGHFKLSPFSGSASSGAGTPIDISTWTTSSTAYPATPTITVTTTTAHGKITGDTVQIYGNQYDFLATYSSMWWGGTFTYSGSLDGSYTITVTTPTEFTFTYTNPSTFALFTSWISQYAKLGSINAPTSNSQTTSNRPEAVAFWAGRVFYTGIQAPFFSNRVYFSQIIQTAAQYGKCYQQADPTDERISDPIDTDGGVIIIPTAHNIYEAIAVGQSLLIFAKNGVWQLGPGSSGIFSPTSYSVRRVSDQGIIGKKCAVLAEHVPYYCSLNDIFRIVQDPNNGFFVTENISEFKVHSLYSALTEDRKKQIKAIYNDLTKKIHFMYGEGSTAPAICLNMALIFDIRLEAFTKYRFGTTTTKFPVGAFVVRQETDSTKKIVYICHAGNILTTRYWDFQTHESVAYTDNGENYNCFLLTSYNTAGNAAHYKQAGYIWVFSRKTETGYTDSGGGTYLPVNESSTYMQSRWEWADASIAGKWGAPQQVYRHRRLYTPTDVTDTFNDGTPLIVTKNLVRGRGRSLHLKFYNSDSTKDSWLAGWHTTYNIQQGK